MAKDYDPKEIEQKWQKEWEDKKLHLIPDTKEGKENAYVLVEFAYPSGNLHLGHWYAFSIPDIYARFLAMQGKNVLYPMGFDAFGLPAENAAIKRQLNPRTWTFDNIDYMRKQLRSMGASFDWSREVITASPEYYKWTQWMFLKFLEKGLAYQSETPVNWCPNDKTVLANEQVVNGVCERCGATVEKRNMLQWNLKITDYAERLINDIEPLDWPKPIKDAQKNWIGKSDGAEIDFELDFKKTPEANENRGPNGERAAIKVFTTRPDTIFGATYLVLAPEHLWVMLATDDNHEVLENKEEVMAYVESVRNKTDIERSAVGKEKTGVELKGVKAINPATKEEIPMWIADYVLPNYGTGAIMAVPVHDERDWEFSQKYQIPTKQVVMQSLLDESNPPKSGKENTFRNMVLVVLYNPKTDKYLTLKWKKQPWKTFITGGVEGEENREEAARREIEEETGYSNVRMVKSLRMREAFFFAAHKDVNRQVHAEHFLFELIDETKAPINQEEQDMYDQEWLSLDELKKTKLQHAEATDLIRIIETGVNIYTGEGILINSAEFDGLKTEEARKKMAEKFGKLKTTYKLRDWVVSRQRYWGCPIPVIHCKECGTVPVPEKDLPVILPDVEDYLPSSEGKSPLAKVSSWVNVSCPKCGGQAERETDTLDTFVDSSWYFLRYADPKNDEEFASKQKLTQWMPIDFYSGGAEHTTMHLLYSRFWHKVLFDLGLVNEAEPYTRRMNRGLILGPDGQKMSKSKGNVIDPDKEVERLGSDSVRMYLAFIGPYNEVGAYPWNPDGLVGVRRFLEKVWRLSNKLGGENLESTLLHQTIKKVGEEIASMKMNTAVSTLMILVNDWEKRENISQAEYETLLKLLAPFAPHMTEELWHELGYATSIHTAEWPKCDESKLVSETATIAVQIDGKVRATFEAPSEIGEKEAIEKAMSLPEVQKWVGDKEVKKAIYVPQKVVNLVIS